MRKLDPVLFTPSDCGKRVYNCLCGSSVHGCHGKPFRELPGRTPTLHSHLTQIPFCLAKEQGGRVRDNVASMNGWSDGRSLG